MIFLNKSPKKVLGLFQLVMINVIAVDSIRTLPFAAEYGFSLIFYYLLASLVFFIPSALVSAELATGWPTTGGIYIWVREAFGPRWGLIVIWLEWVCNVVWYPTIMALIAGVSAYLLDPSLADNKFYMVFMILTLFWGATFVNYLGMKSSSIMSTFCAILGTIFPMILIGVLGVYWVAKGEPSEIGFSWREFFPNQDSTENLALLSNVLFGLIGLDMVATHAAEMKNPRKDYPVALFFSVIIIIATIVFSSLAIAIVVPNSDLNLVTGCLQAFTIFLAKLKLSFLVPFIAVIIVIGSIGNVGAWIIGPAKGLMVAAEDKGLPISLAKKNRHGVPAKILTLQAIVVSILCIVFVVMPSVSSSFWILSAITAQIAMVVYLFLFVAAIKLRVSKPLTHRAFKVPFGNVGMYIVSGAGAISCLIAIILGFIPPLHLQIGNTIEYEIILVSGIALMCLLPYVIYKFHK
jgi:amino acid transporter